MRVQEDFMSVKSEIIFLLVRCMTAVVQWGRKLIKIGPGVLRPLCAHVLRAARPKSQSPNG